jgi:hypothetical protein
LQTASVEKGAAAAKKCGACHTFEKGGPNRVGPNSMASVGEKKGEGKGGFNFSAAMKAKGGDWTYDDLNKFIANTEGLFCAGHCDGLCRQSRRTQSAPTSSPNLRTLSDKPVPLPDGREVSWQRRRFELSERPGIAWPFWFQGDRGLFTGAFRRSRSAALAGKMRKKQHNRPKSLPYNGSSMIGA